ncbi:MAG: indole-3-glycerol phosphate synthase TrpC [Eubacteriales bacterium]
MNKPSILEKILDKKLYRVKQEKEHISLDQIKILSENTQIKNSFYKAIAKDGLSIIGEIKKASPSKGLIKADFDPVKIAKEYADCVDAISVLTENDFFQGHYDYLSAVSQNVDLPILCKDFIADEYQIYKAKAIGASAVLLIVAMLEEKQLSSLYKTAKSIGLDALVETHNIDEAKIAIEIGANIIGVNNRDLNTFDVDITTTIDTAKVIDGKALLVSESGINTKDDISKIKTANIDAILVGETFMKCENISKKAKEFKDAYQD